MVWVQHTSVRTSSVGLAVTVGPEVAVGAKVGPYEGSGVGAIVGPYEGSDIGRGEGGGVGVGTGTAVGSVSNCLRVGIGVSDMGVTGEPIGVVEL